MPAPSTPKLFAPGQGVPVAHESARYSLLHDVYIQCNNKQKLVQTHIPALNQLLGFKENHWIITKDEFTNDGEFRLSFISNFDTTEKSRLLLEVSTLMNRISAGPWGVYLDGLLGPASFYMRAQFTPTKNRYNPPALVSVLFEVLEQQVITVDEEGSHQMSDGTFRIM